jgi:hypothetical protein
MPETYQPKPISFVPPILKRKFIAPDNPREMGTLVFLIGLAIFLVSSYNNVSDIFTRMGKRATTGEFVATAPFRASNPSRLVGVYLFEDENKVPASVRGDRVYLKKNKVPKSAQIVWKRGRPQTAEVVGEYYDYLFGVPVGLGIMGLGLWIRRKRADPYEVAMGYAQADEDKRAS